MLIMPTHPRPVAPNPSHVSRESPPSKLSDRADPYYTAAVGATLSFAFIVLSLVFMFLFPNSRLAITTLEVFHDWALLKQLFLDTTSYLPADNPLTLDGVSSFSPQLSVQEDFQDLVDRGLMTQEKMLNSTIQPDDLWKADPSLLKRLMSASWCAYPNARIGTTPTTRSTGCACIAAVYLEFRRASVNMTANVTFDTRNKYAGKVLSCIDQRPVSKSDTCGRPCTVHPIGLMLYSNSVLFLICVSYMMFTSVQFNQILSEWGVTWRMTMHKSIVGFLGLLLAFPFLLDDWRGNLLNIGGLFLAILNLIYSLHEDLMPLDLVPPTVKNPDGSEPDGHPHPLTSCILVNLPLIIPAYTILLGLSGFARDTWAVLIFGMVGGLIGLVIQRYTWTYWYAVPRIKTETLHVLSCCFLCLFLQLGFMLFGYWDPNASAMAGQAWCYITFYIFLLILAAQVNGDREDFFLIKSDKKCPNHFFSLSLAFLIYIPLGFNILFTGLSVHDVMRS